MMHVISRRTLKVFWEAHPDSKQALQAWFHEARRATWAKPVEIKARYGTASIISNERVVFNICGSSYRLVVRINYESGTVFVRFLGTHKEYDRIDVERI
jgi:mRNA interferase HigB